MSPTDTASRADVGTSSETLGRAISAVLPRKGAVSVRPFDRVTAAVDASHYLLTPRAVVTPNGVDEVAALLALANATGEPLTFRSGGTSLSGQASTGHVLVDTRRHFRAIAIEENGLIARVGPGATVRQVNARLARHGRKLGPDPASEIACTIGGVVANNSSGMACGTSQNTYQTLRSAIIVLASGTVVDTAAPDADERLRALEPGLWQSLADLRAQVTGDPALTREIARQHSMKNTMGYGLNALVDHETPVQILAHLMVGSEGTLGFVAEATFDTVPLHPHAATTLLVFESLTAATKSLLELIETNPATIELMDAASLRAARADEQSLNALPTIEILDHCALLVEYQAATEPELARLTSAATRYFSTLTLTTPALLTDDPNVRDALWRIRKGLYATIAGARPSGTTALLEDIAVPVAQLSATCAGLTRLFAIHGYDDAVIFGHAKDGNIHFLINESFDLEAGAARYRAFTEDMVELVLGAGGTLKAEHGTGRIMAPFVERQYGPTLYEAMLDIKRAFDPNGILNPDAIITSDADLHLRHLKSTPTVEPEVDRCVECGYCEPVCPSKDLTTTPRQRIAVQRAIAEADARGEVGLAAELRRDRQYDVVDTCAVDGMCQTACPVMINTGDLVRRLRERAVGPLERAAWGVAGKAWKPATRAASMALDVAAALPSPLVIGPNAALRVVAGRDSVPMWSRELPRGGRERSGGSGRRADGAETTGAPVAAVYFASCLGAIFGPANRGEGASGAFESLAAKAEVRIVRPPAMAGLCCGTPWKSKGLEKGYREVSGRTVTALWDASDHGRLPVVCENSSCSEGLVLAVEQAAARNPAFAGMRIVDAVDFAAEHLLPAVTIDSRLESIVVHPTCSSTRAGSNANLAVLAGAVADAVTVPDDWGCCAFAGDRGMLHPELTQSATRRESAEVRHDDHDAYVSCNRTCEIGMTRATGRTYVHVLEALDAASSPKAKGVTHE